MTPYHNPIRHGLVLIAPLLLLSSLLLGQTVDWSIGTNALDVAVIPSPSTNDVKTRLIIFPSGNVSIPYAIHRQEDLAVYAERNTLALQLINPVQKSIYLTVYDDQNTVYILKVRAAQPGEEVDDTLIIRNAGSSSGQGGAGGPHLRSPTDTDGAASALLHHMLGGRQLADTSETPITSVVKDRVVPGKILYEDDTLQLNLVKMWQSDVMRGYQVVMTYRGTEPMKLNIQRLWFPGAICVCPSDQLLWSPDRPTADVDSGRAINLFYVSR